MASCSGGAEHRTPDAGPPPPDTGAPGDDGPDAADHPDLGTPLKPAGEYCGADGQCASGHCSADMVCCNTACADACYTCAAAGSLGTCVPADVGTNPRNQCQDMGAASCKQTGQCDGAGACQLYAAGTICAQSGCTDATLTSAGRCDGTGVCAGAGGQSCAPFKCGDNGQCRTTCSADADCVTPNTCVQGSCGKKPLGATCGDNGECNSNICAQGVCCSTTCSGTCKSCGLSGSAGTCTNVPAGMDPLMQCTDGGAMTCGLDGACNGAGACRSYAAGTVCGMDSCSGSTATLAGRCGSGTSAGMCQTGTTQSCSPYVCGTTSCLTRCATNADCVTGYVCNGTICTRKPNGAACTAGSECMSSQCYQGVCCNVACSDSCLSCSLAGTVGTCSPIPDGMPPVPTSQCPAAAASTCGNDGTCNGAGACRQHAAGTVCAAATCTGSTLTSARTCDGAGLCRAAASSSCDPYQCGSNNACRVDCSSTTDCLSPNTCMAMSCGKKPNGATCTTSNECNSSFCAQGVCCATACTGTCKSCSVTGSVGNCVNVPSGSLPTPATQCTDAGMNSCGNDGTCNGSGGCRNYVSGTQCAQATCTGSTFTPPRLCSGTGLCSAAASSSCGAYVCDTTAKVCKTSCDSDADCVSPNVCNASKTCSKKALGAACTGTAECASGFCQQGVCCATACTGTCQSCALAGSSGTCSDVPSGIDPLEQCDATLASTCGTDGTCDGKGGCRLYANGTQCVAATCSGTALVPARTCDGAGVCRTVTSMLCDPFGCDPTAGSVACRTTCGTTSQCAAPNVCVNNSCGNKPNGSTCAAGSECNSGICAQGVCCSTACTGTCRSCAIATSMGTCAAVPAGQDPLDQCTAANAATCDEDGTCNGSGGCRLYASGTECVAASCSGSTLTSRATCNGTGTCGTPTTSSCSPYNCGTTACKTSCTTSADCINTNFVCTGNTCTPALNLQVRLKIPTLGTTQDIRAHFQITNNSAAGMAAVPLSQLTVRYWYTRDQGSTTQIANCDYSAVPGGAGSIVTGPFTAVSPARTKADYYFQFGFSSVAGSLNAGGGTTGEIQMRWHKEPYSNYDQSNDYSYNGSTSYVATTNVTVYRNGTLIYGTEPM